MEGTPRRVFCIHIKREESKLNRFKGMTQSGLHKTVIATQRDKRKVQIPPSLKPHASLCWSCNRRHYVRVKPQIDCIVASFIYSSSQARRSCYITKCNQEVKIICCTGALGHGNCFKLSLCSNQFELFRLHAAVSHLMLEA